MHLTDQHNPSMQIVRKLCMDPRCDVNKEATNHWTAMTFSASPEISAILAEFGGV